MLETRAYVQKCNGPDRNELCRKCGEKGHLVKDCKGENFCLDCKTKGHNTASSGCPRHRKEVGNLLSTIRKSNTKEKKNEKCDNKDM